MSTLIKAATPQAKEEPQVTTPQGKEEKAPQAEPASSEQPRPPKPADRPRTPAHLETREFRMPDNRRVTVARHAITFCIQAKEEGRLIVGLRGAASAMPIVADYDEFRSWWQQR